MCYWAPAFNELLFDGLGDFVNNLLDLTLVPLRDDDSEEDNGEAAELATTYNNDVYR